MVAQGGLIRYAQRTSFEVVRRSIYFNDVAPSFSFSFSGVLRVGGCSAGSDNPPDIAPFIATLGGLLCTWGQLCARMELRFLMPQVRAPVQAMKCLARSSFLDFARHPICNDEVLLFWCCSNALWLIRRRLDVRCYSPSAVAETRQGLQVRVKRMKILVYVISGLRHAWWDLSFHPTALSRPPGDAGERHYELNAIAAGWSRQHVSREGGGSIGEP